MYSIYRRKRESKWTLANNVVWLSAPGGVSGWEMQCSELYLGGSKGRAGARHLLGPGSTSTRSLGLES